MAVSYLALMVALTHVAAAEPPPKGSWVVVVRAVGDVPASWGKDLQQTAERAAQENDDVTIISPPEISVTDLQLAIGCEAWGNGCAGKVAGMMSADMTLTLSLERGPQGLQLGWILVNARGKVLREAPLRPMAGEGDAGLDDARSQLRAIIVGTSPSVLIVETDIPGAELFIDGRQVGTTPYTARDIEPGPHKLRMQLEGRAPLTREVVVEEGRTVRRAFVLSAGTPPAHDPVVGTSEPAPLSVSPLLAFSIAGVGAVVAALSGITYAAHYALFLQYGRQTGETQVDYFARTGLQPDDQIPMWASYGTYGATLVLLGVGSLAAASGGGLVLAWLLLPSE